MTASSASEQANALFVKRQQHRQQQLHMLPQQQQQCAA
jgi:hypothetical protein